MAAQPSLRVLQFYPFACRVVGMKFQALKVLKIFPLNDGVDIVLGSDWCRNVNCNSMFSTNSINFESLCTGQYHELAIQLTTHGILCPVISTVDLDKYISAEDETFVCHMMQKYA